MNRTANVQKIKLEKLKQQLGFPNIHQELQDAKRFSEFYTDNRDTSWYTEAQDAYRNQTINLIAAEGLVSKYVKQACLNDYNRYAEGIPGAREYQGNVYRDMLDVDIKNNLSRLLNVHPDVIDIRPISGTNANIAVYSSLLNRGDRVITLNLVHGGHVSHSRHGILGKLGVDVFHWPVNEDTYEIIPELAVQLIDYIRPKLVTFCGSVMLHPPDIKAIMEATTHKPIVHADIAHVFGLIAGGGFMDIRNHPIDVITSSTQKTFPAPPGGLVITNNREMMESVAPGIFPTVTCHDHGSRLPGFLRAIHEMQEHGCSFVDNVISNAITLAVALDNYGFEVQGNPDMGFTQSHQVLIRDHNAAVNVKLLERNNIICNKNLGAFDYVAEERMEHPTYIRLGVQEVTRRGFTHADMHDLAELMHLVLNKGEDVSVGVMKMMKEHQEVLWCEL